MAKMTREQEAKMKALLAAAGESGDELVDGPNYNKFIFVPASGIWGSDPKYADGATVGIISGAAYYGGDMEGREKQIYISVGKNFVPSDDGEKLVPVNPRRPQISKTSTAGLYKERVQTMECVGEPYELALEFLKMSIKDISTFTSFAWEYGPVMVDDPSDRKQKIERPMPVRILPLEYVIEGGRLLGDEDGGNDSEEEQGEDESGQTKNGTVASAKTASAGKTATPAKTVLSLENRYSLTPELFAQVQALAIGEDDALKFRKAAYKLSPIISGNQEIMNLLMNGKMHEEIRAAGPAAESGAADEVGEEA